MIRKFEHGILCLRDADRFVINVAPKNVLSKMNYRLSHANPDNQVFKHTNPLLAPRVLADWTYQ